MADEIEKHLAGLEILADDAGISWRGSGIPEIRAHIEALTARALKAEGDVERLGDLAEAARASASLAAVTLEQIQNLKPREYEFPTDWSEQVKACEECQRYKGHPIQRGICDTHRRPLWDRDRHDDSERRALPAQGLKIAKHALHLISLYDRPAQGGEPSPPNEPSYADLKREADRMRGALAELVTLKTMKEEMAAGKGRERINAYFGLKDAAWAKARAALSPVQQGGK